MTSGVEAKLLEAVANLQKTAADLETTINLLKWFCGITILTLLGFIGKMGLAIQKLQRDHSEALADVNENHAAKLAEGWAMAAELGNETAKAILTLEIKQRGGEGP